MLFRSNGCPSRTGGRLTVVASGLEDPHALLDGSARVALVIWGVDAREEGDVDAEGVLRQCPRLLDGFPERVRGGLRERSNEACSARGAEGSAQFTSGKENSG